MVLFFQIMAVMIMAKMLVMVIVMMVKNMVMVMLVKKMVMVMVMEGSGRVVRGQMWQKAKWAGSQQLIAVRIEILLFDIPVLQIIGNNQCCK